MNHREIRDVGASVQMKKTKMAIPQEPKSGSQTRMPSLKGLRNR
jgi:hypothetical protein